MFLKRQLLTIASLLVVLLALFLALWAFWWEPASLKTQRNVLVLPGWPEQCDGMTVAVLADLHVGSPFNHRDKLETIVAAVNQQQPDLVLLAGDYVIQGVLGGEFETPETIAATLAALQAGYGVFAVLGNHDWWLDGPRVIRALTDVGISVLEDRAQHLQAQLQQGRCQFWLAGISDYWEAPHDIEKALGDIPTEATTVAFTHNPDIFPLVPEAVALTVAGHTHGGQVRVPLFGPPIVPSEHGQRFAAGHIVEEGRHLFVSTGLGTSILPVRFLVPPVITLLELRSPHAVAVPDR